MRRLLALAIPAVLGGLLFAQEARVQVRLSSEEIDDVIFDPARANKEQIQQWVLLSKDGPYDEATLSSCIELQADPQSKRFEEDRARFKKLTDQLDEAKYPPELSEVIRHFRQVRSLWLWVDTQTLGFLQTDDISTLEQKYEDVDPSEACAKPLEKIRSSKNHPQAVNLACLDWSNCITAAAKQKIGPYPEEAWKHFLSAYGITEHIISTEER